VLMRSHTLRSHSQVLRDTPHVTLQLIAHRQHPVILLDRLTLELFRLGVDLLPQ
jgi:hypothetical protein